MNKEWCRKLKTKEPHSDSHLESDLFSVLVTYWLPSLRTGQGALADPPPALCPVPTGRAGSAGPPPPAVPLRLQPPQHLQPGEVHGEQPGVEAEHRHPRADLGHRTAWKSRAARSSGAVEARLQQEDLGVPQPDAGLAERGVAQARDDHLVIIMLQMVKVQDTNLLYLPACPQVWNPPCTPSSLAT